MLTVLATLLVGLLLSRPRPRALLVDGLAGGALALQRRYGARALARSVAERTRPIRLEPFEPVLAGVGAPEPIRAFSTTASRPAAPRPPRDRPLGVRPARTAARRRPLTASASARPRAGAGAGAPTELATIVDRPPAEPAPSFALAVIGKAGGECYPLARENTIGRAAAATIRIDDPDISRLHAQLTVSGGGVHLIDLGSANGTFVNDARCHDAAVEPGDVIRVGKRFEARLVGGEE